VAPLALAWGSELVMDTLTAKNGVVATLRRPDTIQDDPFVVKFSSRNTLSAHDKAKQLFSIGIAGAVRLAGISDKGDFIALVDQGYDPEELSVLESKYKKRLDDRAFTQQRLLVVNKAGQISLQRTFGELGQPPDNIKFSPSSEWLTYSLGSGKTILMNLKSTHEESFESNIVGWDPDDAGVLTKWWTEGKTGAWTDFEGRKVWKPAKTMTQRKYRWKPGGQVEKLEEIRTVAL